MADGDRGRDDGAQSGGDLLRAGWGVRKKIDGNQVRQGRGVLSGIWSLWQGRADNLGGFPDKLLVPVFVFLCGSQELRFEQERLSWCCGPVLRLMFCAIREQGRSRHRREELCQLREAVCRCFESPP